MGSLSSLQFGSQGNSDLHYQANQFAMSKLHKYLSDPAFRHRDTAPLSQETRAAHMESAAGHYRAESKSRKSSPTVVRERLNKPKRKLYG